MKQYCRYCSNCCCGDICYCCVKKQTMSDEKAKRVNHCKDFEFNPLDVFGGFDKDGNPLTYHPRKNKPKTKADYDEGIKTLSELFEK